MTQSGGGHRQQYGARKAVLWLVVAEAVVALSAVPSPSAADVTAVNGRAFGASGNVRLFGGDPQVLSPQPTVTLPATGGAVSNSQQSIVFRAGPADILTTGPANVSSQGTLGPSGSVTSTATLQDVAIGGTTATTLSATCTASEGGRTGSTTVVGGRVPTSDPNREVEGDEVYTDVPANPPPGFQLNGFVPSVSTDYYRVVFNEQIVTQDTITVRAAHFYLGENPPPQNGPVARGEVIVGEVTCGVTAVTPPSTNTTAPTTTTTAPTTTTTAPTTTLPPATTTTAPGATTTVPQTTTTTTLPPATTTTVPATTTTAVPPTTGVPPTTTTTVSTETTTTTTTAPIQGPTSATGAVLNGGRIAPANCPPGGGTGTAPGMNAGLLRIGALNATCTDTSATASAASVTLAWFRFGLVQSQCTAGPNGTASSAVLVISGAGMLPDGAVVSTPTSVSIGALTIRLNEVITGGTRRTVNALHITAPGVDVIVAQSSCGAAPPASTTAALTTTTTVPTTTPTPPTSTIALTTTSTAPTATTTSPTSTTAAPATTTTSTTTTSTTTALPPTPCNPPNPGLIVSVYTALSPQVPGIVRPFVHNAAVVFCVGG